MASHPMHELIGLYVARWDIEVHIRALKHVHGLNVLSTKTPQVVSREIASGILAHNAVRVLMATTANDPGRLSHTRTIALLLQISEMMAAAGTSRLPELFQRLLAAIQATLQPLQRRPPEPRLVLPSRRYPYLKISRAQWRRRFHATG